MEDIIDIHLNGQLYLYLSNIIKKQDYDIYYSDLIDDEYWNFAYLNIVSKQKSHKVKTKIYLYDKIITN